MNQDPFLNDQEFESPGPFKKDMLENGKGSELSEKDFIREKPPARRFPFWLWLFLLTVIAALIWGSLGWFRQIFQSWKPDPQTNPFLNVTNRQLSNFLWQFSGLMRAHIQNKTGYLPGFLYMEREGLDPRAAENIVSAPPEVLFLYHTWDRLLAFDEIARPIPQSEFVEFLNQAEEWKPQNWPQSSSEYTELVNTLRIDSTSDLQIVSEKALPSVVRKAFQGWKNYFVEGEQISQLTPTFEQVQSFLQQHPTYARHYWRNITEVHGTEVAGPNYLLSLQTHQIDPHAIFPIDQLAPFLKVALFNAIQGEKGL
jgi:hypothetical protein